jgi:hypothetical protein
VVPATLGRCATPKNIFMKIHTNFVLLSQLFGYPKIQSDLLASHAAKMQTELDYSPANGIVFKLK